MIEYKDIKDLVIYQDTILGEFTLGDLLDEIEKCNNENKKFEDITSNILHNTEMDKTDINTVLNLSKTDSIEFYLSLIKDEL